MNQEKIGKYIRKIRKDNNLSQEKFAEKLGVTFQAVSKWERGINLPDMAILKAISDEFNIPIDDIINGEDTYESFGRFNNFAEEYLSDIHNGNIGFNVCGKPVILDYSGFHESC